MSNRIPKQTLAKLLARQPATLRSVLAQTKRPKMPAAKLLEAASRTALEHAFATLWRGHARAKGLDLASGPRRQHRFHATRKWQFDFAWPAVLVAVEIEGGQWVAGRHQRGAGYQADCEKYNAAALDGWLVLRFTGDDLKRRPVQCCEQVAAAIESRTEAGGKQPKEKTK